jgi:hypothetical protein
MVAASEYRLVRWVQEACDELMGSLIKHGYPALTLHGGMDQADRDSTLADYKNKAPPPHLHASPAPLPSAACRPAVATLHKRSQRGTHPTHWGDVPAARDRSWQRCGSGAAAVRQQRCGSVGMGGRCLGNAWP